MSAANPRSGRVESSIATRLLKTADPAKSANDSRAGKHTGSKRQAQLRRRSGYVTRRRLETIGRSLSGRQQAVLIDVKRLNVASGRQLERLHYGNSQAARRLARLDLSELVEVQVLARLGRRIGGVRAGSAGFVYALGLAGKRLAWPDAKRYRRPWTPEEWHLRHALAVSELYVWLRQVGADAGWQLTAFDAEPSCWRSFHGPGGGHLILKPDAHLIIEDENTERRAFVEVDRATEPLTRIAAKAKMYVRYWSSGREQEREGIFPLVLWVAPNAKRATAINEVLSDLPLESPQLFATCITDNFISAVTGYLSLPQDSNTTQSNELSKGGDR